MRESGTPMNFMDNAGMPQGRVVQGDLSGGRATVVLVNYAKMGVKTLESEQR